MRFYSVGLNHGLNIHHSWNCFSQYSLFPSVLHTNALTHFSVSHSVSHLTLWPVREMWIVCSEPSITAATTAL